MRLAFNYDLLPENQRLLARRNARKILKLPRLSARSTVEIGKLLSAVRHIVPGPAYRAWLRSELEWSHAAGYFYETAAKRFGKVDRDSLARFRPGAIRVLSHGDVKTEAIEKAIERAQSGEIVSRTDAVNIIRGQVATGYKPIALRRPIYQFRSAVRALQAIPIEERRQFADELNALAAQLRQGELAAANSVEGRGKPPILESDQETAVDTRPGVRGPDMLAIA